MAERFSLEEYLATGWRIDSGYEIEKGGLAGPVRPNDGSDLAGFHGQVNLVDCGQAPKGFA
jgi:hypothetical protein